MASHISDSAEVSDEELAVARRYPMVVCWSPEYGAYVAQFPSLPGIGISGKTAAEAARKGEEIIVNYVTVLLDAGRELPELVALAKNRLNRRRHPATTTRKHCAPGDVHYPRMLVGKP